MRKLIGWIAVFTLLLCAACAEAPPRQEQAFAAYAAVLLEGAEYIPVDEEVRPLDSCTPVRFAVLDMEGDGMIEVVLEVTEPEGFIILTYFTDGEVYAGEVPYRGLLSLKDDGTCTISSGAMDNGVAKTCFVVFEATGKPDAIGRYLLAESYTAPDGSVHYAMNGRSETTDEAGYREFLAMQDEKLDALWYEYTPENVRLLLGQ